MPITTPGPAGAAPHDPAGQDTDGRGRGRARIDLHTHSRWSDGTSTVDELVAEARATGLDTIALTDHDTTAGWVDAADAARRHGVRVVPGIEVSTEYAQRSVHVLALMPSPDPDTDLAREIGRAHRSRETRARTMVDRLAEDFPITWHDVLAQVAGADTTVGRPHIADALVAAGVFPDRSAAFADVLSAHSPYYVRHYAPAPEDAVRAIVDAGGVAIAAHPASGVRDGGVPTALLGSMVEAGLAGIEVDHREHDAAARAGLRDLARRYGLVRTGGSDYHGTGKPNRLGENTTDPRALERLLEQVTSGVRVLHAEGLPAPDDPGADRPCG
jgi:predicted metal-dependent phosphoesterase TrpH